MKTTKDLYEKLIKLPNLHSIPELKDNVIIWKLYKKAYITATCEDDVATIEIVSNSKIKGSLMHWHPYDEKDILEDLYELGKKGNILVIKTNLISTSTFYYGQPSKYKFNKDKKWHWGLLTYLEQK